MNLRSTINLRKWLILATLFQLNLRFLFFKSRLLNDLPFHRRNVALKITADEIGFATKWNTILSKSLSVFCAQYTACMKRCFVLALVLDRSVGAKLLLGIEPGRLANGHAWIVDRTGLILADHFDEHNKEYKVVKHYVID